MRSDAFRANHARRVVILQRDLPHYRMPFFVELNRRLRASDVELTVVYGAADTADADRYEWSLQRTTQRFPAGALWQPALDVARSADLIIVEQATKLLINYLLLARQHMNRERLALWGHGKNFQPTRWSAPAEWMKRRVSTQVHWWFAYNELSADVVSSLGFPRERITDVQNSVDTRSFRELLAQAKATGRSAILARYGLAGNEVGIYCGRLYAEKRLAFLLEAADEVRASRPTFELVVIGSGPDEDLVQAAAANRPWLHPVGAKFGREKAELFSVGDMFLMPGAVGLAILDAFAAGLPLVTIRNANHGPEVAYLEDCENSRITPDEPHRYAKAIADLFEHPEALEQLRRRAWDAGGRYTIESMADNFHDGILRAIEHP